jgi:hypothetical protein
VKALRRQGDPNYVPFLELFADREVIAAALGDRAITKDAAQADREVLEKALDQRIRFWHHLGYDAFWQGATLELPDMLRLELDDTAALSKGKRNWVDEKAGIITNWADFERYPWPCTADADGPEPARGDGHDWGDRWPTGAGDVAHGVRDVCAGDL